MRKFNHMARRWCVKQARQLGIECTTATVNEWRGPKGQVVLTNNGKEVGCFCVTLLDTRDSEGVRRALTCADCGAIVPDTLDRWYDSRRLDDGRLVRVLLCVSCVKAQNETRKASQ
jgi:hypothetical protein